MAQHDMNVADGSGAVVRSDLNGALEALTTCQLGASAPSPTWPLMWWGDTGNGLLKQRNAANTAWINRCDLATAFLQTSDVAAGGSAGLLRADGDGSQLTGIGLPSGYINGFLVNNNGSDADHDLDVTAGYARNDSNTLSISTASTMTKKMDATFVKGSASGGLGDGVSLPASGVLYVFAITEDSTGDVDFFGDTDGAGANVPGGWTVQRRVTSGVPTDASSNILPFKKHGVGSVVYVSNSNQSLDYSVTTVSTSRTSLPLTAPPDVLAEIHAFATSTVNSSIVFTALDEPDLAPASAGIADLRPNSDAVTGIVTKTVRVNASRNIGIRRGDSDLADIKVRTIGWWESR